MPTISSLARPSLLAFVLPATLLAQNWVQRTTPAAPSARSSSPAAYDVYRGVTTLFGGRDGANTPLGDTWEYDGVAWTPRVTGQAPAARWGHGMAFDQRRGCVVLFGGDDGSAMRNDTWEWNGVVWTLRAVPSAPPARGHFGMAYDAARGVVVAFGGLGNGLAILGDTWEYDGATWTQRNPANAPGPRRGVAFTWDETRRETLLFGGSNGSQLFGDLWAWNGTSWLLKSSTGPGPRQEGCFAFDGNCGRAVLFGGADQNVATSFGDSWQWSAIGWSQLVATQPPARHGAAMVHDAQRGQFVLHGGRDATSIRTDTWELARTCNRTVMVTAAPIVGQTARFLYLYPWAAANQHVCWTLVTARQPMAFALPIPGMPSIGLCRIDPLNQLFAPSTSLNGSGILSTTIPVPANPAFAGFQFDVQYVDLDLATLALRWSDNDAQMTTALSPTPVASFTATPTSGVAPMLVQFTDTSANIPTSWQWDFDNDGVVDSTVQNPAWTYTQNGVYSVRLVASNASGSSTVTRNSLVVAYDPNQPNPLLHMIPIAPGVFQMGSAAGQANEQPVHQVTLTMPFWMCRHEVTQAEYQTLMGSNPSSFTGPSAPNAPQRPVEMVSWSDAVAYCQALTAIEQAAGRVPVGYRYRLPTEAEWEYCCRAGTTTEWHVGMSLSTSEANFGGALANTAYPNGQTTAVESYAPNAFGLRDMHGNVSEWCLDAYSSYTPGPATNPYVPYVPGSSYNVTRGGGWLHFAFGNRSACRYTVTGPVTTFAFPDVGFRIVLAPALGP